MSAALVNGSDNLHASRLRALMSVDDALRDVLALLEASGALANTFVVVTSDHGYRLGQWGLWCEKASPYETDARVPLAVRGPGVPAGAVLEALVSMNVDLGPTLLELAGVPDAWPSAPGQRRDGVSLVPLLAGGRGGAPPPGWRERVLVEFVGWQADEWLSPCQFALSAPNFVNCSGAPPAGLINSASNRYVSLRVKNATTDAMYGEWRRPLTPASPSETNWTACIDKTPPTAPNHPPTHPSSKPGGVKLGPRALTLAGAVRPPKRPGPGHQPRRQGARTACRACGVERGTLVGGGMRGRHLPVVASHWPVERERRRNACSPQQVSGARPPHHHPRKPGGNRLISVICAPPWASSQTRHLPAGGDIGAWKIKTRAAAACPEAPACHGESPPALEEPKAALSDMHQTGSAPPGAELSATTQ